MINNVVLVCVQHSDSVIHIHVSFFQILFRFRLLYNIEQSSLHCTVGPCLLSIKKKNYLAMSGLSCGTWDLLCVKQDLFIVAHGFFFILFLAVLSLSCFVQAFSSCVERGFACCRAQVLGAWASGVAASGPSSCGTRV